MTSTLVVDGSNIATEGRSAPSLAQLDEAVRAIISEHPHETLVVVVDATFGHRIDPSESTKYEEAINANELITPPAGAIGRGDAFVLQIADRANATVFSNDSFQEFHGRYPWLFHEGRLIGGKPVPGVGWVFVPRVPVRGPLSRKAVREAKLKSAAASRNAGAGVTAAPSAGAKATKTPSSEAGARAPKAARGKQPATDRSSTPADGAAKRPATASSSTPADGAAKRPAKRATPPPINEPTAFLNFVTDHPLGSLVEGEVEVFTSHGAYLRVGDARCYLPLKAMGDPPPTSPRKALSIGERRRVVVTRVDTPRRGIDVALPSVEIPTIDEAQLIDIRPTDQPAEEAALAPTKKAPAKKAPAKKAPAKKAPAAAKKAPAKKAPAAAKKAPAKKAPAAAKKAPAKKAPAKKAPAAAKKAPAKKAPAAAKKAPAKKAPAKKAPAAAKKAPAKKAPAKKAPAAAKKAPAKKAPAAAKKAPAKKAPAAAKKAPAKKA